MKKITEIEPRTSAKLSLHKQRLEYSIRNYSLMAGIFHLRLQLNVWNIPFRITAQLQEYFIQNYSLMAGIFHPELQLNTWNIPSRITA